MGPEQWLFLQWHEHKGSLVSTFEKLFERNTFVDCTLAAEGQYLNVHKMILSACSPYFEILLNENRDKHPIIILKDVKFRSLKSIIEYMYRGEANVLSTEMKEFLAAAETLQIKGLGKQGGGDTRSQPTKDRRDLVEKQPLPLSSSMQIINEEKDNWADSDLSSTLTEPVQKSFVTQKNPSLLSQGDVGTKIPITQKIQKSVTLTEESDENKWLKTEDTDKIPKCINPILPSPLSLGSHTIEPVHPASMERMPDLNARSTNTQKMVPSTSDTQVGMDAVPKVEPEPEPEAEAEAEAEPQLPPAAAEGLEDAETASAGSSVIELSDTTEEWAEEDMEEGPTASQDTGNSFGGGTDESRARFDAVSDATRETMSRDLVSEQDTTLCFKYRNLQRNVNQLQPLCASHHQFSCAGSTSTEVDKASGSTVRNATVHPPQTLHACPVCTKSFFRSGHLKDHMAIHKDKNTARQKYDCTQKKFETEPHMHHHCGGRHHVCKCRLNKKGDLVSQDKQGGVIPHKCCKCNYTMVQTGPLIIHQRFHNNERPNKCKECRTAKMHCSNIQKNSLVQAGNHIQKGRTCETTKAHSYSLKIHLDNHTGKRAYQCPDCSAKFTHKCALNYHRKRFHGTVASHSSKT